jgi:CRP/FNR family transcriptional regulator
MAIPLDFLKRIPYFAGLQDRDLASIKNLFFEKTAERGEMLALEGDPAEELYFVASGVVKVLKTSPEGREQILSIVRPGESFNDVPVFDGGPNHASAQAMGPVVLYGIHKADLETTIAKHPRLALNVSMVLASRVRNLVSLVEDLSFKQVIGRVARILLENSGDRSGPRPQLTQQDMAAIAGTAREVVGRSLKALEEKGAIRLEHRRIVIKDKEALRQIMAVP